MFELIVQGIVGCLAPINLLTIIITVSLGIIVGALPGFGAATGLILVLPLTYSLDPGTAFVALTGVYVGAEYGGSISSILLNTPGTGGAVVTCFDGFPMAQQGKAREALFISNIASFTGGIISGLVMLFCLPLLGGIVLQFGAGEIFALAVIGLLLVGSISQGSPIKGVASASLGIFMTCIGADSFMGNLRFDFDIPILIGGIPFIPVMLGVFSVPHLLGLVMRGSADSQKIIVVQHLSMRENIRVFCGVFRSMFSRMKLLLVRSGLIGVLIGIVPGVGGAVSTMVAYSAAKRASKHPEAFGKGAEEGIAAPECSNNGLVGGSLIPVLALGIPGSPAAAIFMGAIFLHGMTPGPNFLVNQADIVYLLVMAVFLAAVVQLLLGLFTIGSFAAILNVPPVKLFSAILAVCSIGAYVVRGLEFDVWLFAGFGLAAFFLLRIGFNAGAFILGMILGTITERSLLESLTIASAKGGVAAYFMSRDIAIGIVGLTLVYLGWRLYATLRARRSRVTVPETAPVRCAGSWSGLRGCDAAVAIGIFSVCGYLYSMLDDLAESTALFPRMVLVVLMVTMVALLGKTLFFGTRYAEEQTSPFAGLPWKTLGCIVLVWGLYLCGITEMGFYSATGTMVFVFCTILPVLAGKTVRSGDVARNALFAVVFSAASYVVFHQFFQIVTPQGIFV